MLLYFLCVFIYFVLVCLNVSGYHNRYKVLNEFHENVANGLPYDGLAYKNAACRVKIFVAG